LENPDLIRKRCRLQASIEGKDSFTYENLTVLKVIEAYFGAKLPEFYAAVKKSGISPGRLCCALSAVHRQCFLRRPRVLIRHWWHT
jgi:hypothetical protein